MLVAPLTVGVWLRLGRAVHRQKQAGYARQCHENLLQLGIALRQYAIDADDRLPPAEAWADCVLDRVGRDTAFACPADPTHARTSYALYAGATRGRLGSLLAPDTVPLLYDSDRRLWSARDPVPEPASPPRHLGANNVLFASGAVRPCAPYEALGEAGFERTGTAEEPEVERCPPYPGATRLCVAPTSLGFRTEYPADWAVTLAPGELVLAPADSPNVRVTFRRGDSVPTAPADGLPPDAQLIRQFRIDVSLRADFPTVAEGVEIVADGVHKARLVVPVEPRLLVVLAAPEASWEGLRPALFLPLASLQLDPSVAEAESRTADTEPRDRRTTR